MLSFLFNFVEYIIKKIISCFSKILFIIIFFVYFVFLDKEFFEFLEDPNKTYIKRKIMFYFYKVSILLFLSIYIIFKYENIIKSLNRYKKSYLKLAKYKK